MNWPPIAGPFSFSVTVICGRDIALLSARGLPHENKIPNTNI